MRNVSRPSEVSNGGRSQDRIIQNPACGLQASTGPAAERRRRRSLGGAALLLLRLVVRCQRRATVVLAARQVAGLRRGPLRSADAAGMAQCGQQMHGDGVAV